MTPGTALPTPLRLPVKSAVLNADLEAADEARRLVVFAHGSGSSRFSPRNRRVALYLHEQGLATLLLDLLTEAEQADDEYSGVYRFNIALLAQRLEQVLDHLVGEQPPRWAGIGLFGASTGAAAALIAAAHRAEWVQAVVARGGRPDLAQAVLAQVRAPTLLIVGGHDEVVLELNRAAHAQLSCVKRLDIIPGATHLFEEPGALEAVAKRAGTWFCQHLPQYFAKQIAPHDAQQRTL